MKGAITSEFYQGSADNPVAEYYSPKTRIAAVQGEAVDEAYYVWIAGKPDTRSPSPDTHFVVWIPRAGTLRRNKATEKLPISVERVDGIGFLHPKVTVDEFLMDPSTSTVTGGGEPPSGPGQHTIYPGRRSIAPEDRTGLGFDLLSGDVLLKGPRGSAVKLTEEGIHTTKPVKTLEMNSRAWQEENFLADFLPSFPTYPVGMQRLPNLPMMADMFGAAGKIMNAIAKIKELMK